MKKQNLIGSRIQKVRKQRGITQESLAEKAGVPYPTLIKIENGQVKNPTIKTVKKIAEALGVTIDYLTHES